MLKKTCQSFIYCQILTSLISLLGKKKTLNEKQEPVMVMTEIILEIYDQNNISFNVGLLLLKIKFSLFFFSGMKYPIVIRNTKVKILFLKKSLFMYLAVPGPSCVMQDLIVAACRLLGLLVVVCGIQFYHQGSNLSPLHWKHRVLTTGLPEHSQSSQFEWCLPNYIRRRRHSTCICFSIRGLKGSCLNCKVSS